MIPKYKKTKEQGGHFLYRQDIKDRILQLGEIKGSFLPCKDKAKSDAALT